jgi:hypothetical protein
MNEVKIPTRTHLNQMRRKTVETQETKDFELAEKKKA